MNAQPKIESGVPIPPKGLRHTKWADLARKMKPSQSVLLATANEARAVAWNLGVGHYTWRKVNGSGIRIWKV